MSHSALGRRMDRLALRHAQRKLRTLEDAWILAVEVVKAGAWVMEGKVAAWRPAVRIVQKVNLQPFREVLLLLLLLPGLD